MTPLSFKDRFGWLHDAPGSCGVVLCGAQGYEQLCAHKSWRALAERIAALGFPVLRFDYGGAGDSLGTDRDPDRLEDWLESVRLAITELKARTGVDRIVLVGLRLGATLAARVASEMGGVAGIAMLAPVASGRAYARELSAFARMVARPATGPVGVEPPPGLEVQGFLLSNDTQASLKSFELMAGATAPAPKLLLVSPDTQANSAAIREHFEKLGADVATGDFANYAQFIAEPTFSKTPEVAFAAVTDWLRLNFEPGSSAARPVVEFRPASLAGDGFVDEPILFGPDGRLFGMLCEPANPDSAAPLLVFVNAGANPHIGWARMCVEGARGLAAQGIASFRLDAAGLGDSPPAPGRPDQVMYSMEAVEDVRAALDWLEGRGYRDFCVVGLCSGAHMAFHAAVADKRVGGLIMANLQKFIWKDGDSLEIAVSNAYRSTDFYKGQALRLDTWKRLLKGDIAVAGIAKAVLGRVGAALKARLDVLTARIAMSGDADMSRVRNWFRALTKRGTRILLVYSAEDGGLDELAHYMGAGGKQAAKMPGVSISILDGADHNLTPHWSRIRFFELVAQQARAMRSF